MFDRRLPERRLDKGSERRNTFRMLTLITQFGINMLVPIAVCFFAGMWLDKKLGTNFIMIIGFFIGAVAGFRNIYVFATKSMKEPGKALDIPVKEESDTDKDTEDKNG